MTKRLTWQVETNDRTGRAVDRRLVLRARLDGKHSHWMLQRVGTDLWELNRDDWPEGSYLAADLPTAFDMAADWIATQSHCEWCDGAATTTRPGFVPDGVRPPKLLLCGDCAEEHARQERERRREAHP